MTVGGERVGKKKLAKLQAKAQAKAQREAVGWSLDGPHSQSTL